MPTPILAITGHRQLPAGGSAARAACDRLFAVLGAAAPAPPRLLSALAEGADRIAAESAVAHGLELQAVLPFQPEAYRATFADPAAEGFSALLDRADSRFTIADWPLPASAESAAFEPLTGLRYATLGRLLTGHCAILLAIWDGAAPRGRGGTAEVVARARQAGRPVIRIDSADGEITCAAGPPTTPFAAAPLPEIVSRAIATMPGPAAPAFAAEQFLAAPPAEPAALLRGLRAALGQARGGPAPLPALTLDLPMLARIEQLATGCAAAAGLPPLPTAPGHGMVPRYEVVVRLVDQVAGARAGG